MVLKNSGQSFEFVRNEINTPSSSSSGSLKLFHCLFSSVPWSCPSTNTHKRPQLPFGGWMVLSLQGSHNNAHQPGTSSPLPPHLLLPHLPPVRGRGRTFQSHLRFILINASRGLMCILDVKLQIKIDKLCLLLFSEAPLFPHSPIQPPF